MVGIDDLTVGTVSGMIAAAVTFIQIFVPLALPLILLGLLWEKGKSLTLTAATWSVLSRIVHSSEWPAILRADSATAKGVYLPVSATATLHILFVLVIAVVAIVTPMGLYENVIPDETVTETPFHYIEDPSVFGQATLPRGDLPWSRICGGLGPWPCPNSNSNITGVSDETGLDVEGDWYDSRVPQHVVDAFQSGLELMSDSVSSFFDIQWRSYTQQQINDKSPIKTDNNTAYPVGTFSHIETLALIDEIRVVEGLIVDMVNGGIGFRNHTAPPKQKHGSTWSEDILFIEPVTHCADTNMTLDFEIPSHRTGTTVVSNLVLTDRGGFTNLITDYPDWIPGDTQEDPQFEFRAWRAAWLTNAVSMTMMNVTNAANESDPDSPPAFQYINSEVGKEFPLHNDDGETIPMLTIAPNAIRLSASFGRYLEGTTATDHLGFNNSFGENSTRGEGPLYPDTFEMASMLGDVGMQCEGSAGQDEANITNFAVKCGTVLGTPRRHDDGPLHILDPGSRWTIPMYTCVSATKASIKTVDFVFNGTTDNLSNLKARAIREKVYPDEESKPLWGVEKTTDKLVDVSPIWGLVSPEAQDDVEMTTLRKEFLYVPGHSGSFSGEFNNRVSMAQNLPAMDFPARALSSSWSEGDSMGTADYTGETNFAMSLRWREYTQNVTTVHKILNLIWTDLSANSVVGTKNLAGDELPAQSNGSLPIAADNGDDVDDDDDDDDDDDFFRFRTKKRATEDDSDDKGPPLVPVTIHRRRIRYKLAYGIPAFVLLALTVGITLALVVLLCCCRTGVNKMKRYLSQTSTGRILTIEKREDGLRRSATSGLPTKLWVNGPGREEITLGGENECLDIDMQLLK